MTGMKDAFRKQGIPGWYTTRLYYALHFPHKLGDFLTIFVFVAVCFLAVPCGIFFQLLPAQYRTIPVLIAVYFACIFLFGGIYTFIGNSSKSRYNDMLKMGKQTWDEIEQNQKLVKKRRKAIMGDSSEEGYNLASFDDEIAQLNQKISQTTARKESELNNFETVTKNILADELTRNVADRIGSLTAARDDAAAKLKDTSDRRQAAALSLADKYEVILGREYMDEEKLDALAEILRSGKALNLADAVQEYETAGSGRNQ